MAKPTLNDLAKVCDVDISTVSRALRGDPRVKASSRQRICETAERLGYRPNLLARNLAGGKTRTLWIIMPSLDAVPDYRLVRAASHVANARDYSLFVALHDCDNYGALEGHSIAHYEQILAQASQGLSDGVIILPRRHESDVAILSELVRQKIPIVFADNYVPELPVPVVSTDNHQAAADLARKCADFGVDEALLLFPEPNPVARARLAGAREAFQQLGIPALVRSELPEDWVPSPSTARMAILSSHQDYLHRFAVRQEKHLKNKSMVFGVFDDWTGEPSPAESVIIAIQNHQEIAKTSVDLLIRLIEHPKAAPPKTLQNTVPIAEFRTLCQRFT